MSEHELKTWPQFFAAIIDGSKTFEVRKDDRHFQVGDVLRLREWRVTAMDRLEMTGEYTGRETTRMVSYVMRGPAFGIKDGHCVLALTPEGEEK